ncbi:hypothetical protein H696_02665 [Fonticula alba]|uniref:Uncharacterized protein n=1 Tax=Fonticula alba TaxID=691883 RepID=A0A058Z8T1_FONAL|nr:hypothetical protein H696_02665 [Fonticula alba]KCV70338.1 hypothetical protein H696_02665 [Fonticula alba]|eukprot:XP_009494854.1 hypothetical protein H696_02665 [Fonticula alba]
MLRSVFARLGTALPSRDLGRMALFLLLGSFLAGASVRLLTNGRPRRPGAGQASSNSAEPAPPGSTGPGGAAPVASPAAPATAGGTPAPASILTSAAAAADDDGATSAAAPPGKPALPAHIPLGLATAFGPAAQMEDVFLLALGLAVVQHALPDGAPAGPLRRLHPFEDRRRLFALTCLDMGQALVEATAGPEFAAPGSPGGTLSGGSMRRQGAGRRPALPGAAAKAGSVLPSAGPPGPLLPAGTFASLLGLPGVDLDRLAHPVGWPASSTRASDPQAPEHAALAAIHAFDLLAAQAVELSREFPELDASPTGGAASPARRSYSLRSRRQASAAALAASPGGASPGGTLSRSGGAAAAAAMLADAPADPATAGALPLSDARKFDLLWRSLFATECQSLGQASPEPGLFSGVFHDSMLPHLQEQLAGGTAAGAAAAPQAAAHLWRADPSSASEPPPASADALSASGYYQRMVGAGPGPGAAAPSAVGWAAIGLPGPDVTMHFFQGGQWALGLLLDFAVLRPVECRRVLRIAQGLSPSPLPGDTGHGSDPMARGAWCGPPDLEPWHAVHDEAKVTGFGFGPAALKLAGWLLDVCLRPRAAGSLAGDAAAAGGPPLSPALAMVPPLKPVLLAMVGEAVTLLGVGAGDVEALGHIGRWAAGRLFSFCFVRLADAWRARVLARSIEALAGDGAGDGAPSGSPTSPSLGLPQADPFVAFFDGEMELALLAELLSMRLGDVTGREAAGSPASFTLNSSQSAFAAWALSLFPQFEDNLSV